MCPQIRVQMLQLRIPQARTKTEACVLQPRPSAAKTNEWFLKSGSVGKEKSQRRQHRLLELSGQRVTLPAAQARNTASRCLLVSAPVPFRGRCHCFLCPSSWQTCQSRERFSLATCVLSDLTCPHDDCSFPCQCAKQLLKKTSLSLVHS